MLYDMKASDYFKCILMTIVRKGSGVHVKPK
jgi:hypothetical protein